MTEEKTLKDKEVDSMYLPDNTKCYKSENVKESIIKEREDLRALIWEIAGEYGVSILHYNEKIDDIHHRRFGDFNNN